MQGSNPLAALGRGGRGRGRGGATTGASGSGRRGGRGGVLARMQKQCTVGGGIFLF